MPEVPGTGATSSSLSTVGDGFTLDTTANPSEPLHYSGALICKASTIEALQINSMHLSSEPKQAKQSMQPLTNEFREPMTPDPMDPCSKRRWEIRFRTFKSRVNEWCAERYGEPESRRN